MTSASPGNLGPVTGVWGEKVGISWGFWVGLKGKSPMIISGSPYIICCSWDALSKLMGLGRCKLMGLWKSTKTVGPHLLKVDLNLLHQPSQSCPESQGPWRVPSGFPAIFGFPGKPHLPPAVLLIGWPRPEHRIVVDHIRWHGRGRILFEVPEIQRRSPRRNQQKHV